MCPGVYVVGILGRQPSFRVATSPLNRRHLADELEKVRLTNAGSREHQQKKHAFLQGLGLASDMDGDHTYPPAPQSTPTFHSLSAIPSLLLKSSTSHPKSQSPSSPAVYQKSAVTGLAPRWAGQPPPAAPCEPEATTRLPPPQGQRQPRSISQLDARRQHQAAPLSPSVVRRASPGLPSPAASSTPDSITSRHSYAMPTGDMVGSKIPTAEAAAQHSLSDPPPL
eukprot:gene6417-6195_t